MCGLESGVWFTLLILIGDDIADVCTVGLSMVTALSCGSDEEREQLSPFIVPSLAVSLLIGGIGEVGNDWPELGGTGVPV